MKIDMSSHSPQHKIFGLLSIILASCFALKIILDVVESRVEHSAFYLSESFLFSSVWWLFLPLLYGQFVAADLYKTKGSYALVVLTPFVTHLFAYPAVVWLISKLFYYWHTDDKGLYSSNNETPPQAKYHGKLRGWVKSDESGIYAIKTSRPAAYPSQDIPQYIHLSIKEPDIENEYYADLYFDDEPLYLKHKKKYGKIDRAGTEIVRVLLDNKNQVAEHNIVLGLNIPNYPAKNTTLHQSGLNIGEDQPSFIPFHAFGPDKGTRTCPVCKYGRYHGIVYFVGDNPNWNEIKKWLNYLDSESSIREKYLKAYFVYGNSKNYNKQTRQTELEKIGNELGLQKIALTYVPSFTDTESEANLNNINAMVENTFIIYRHRTIVDRHVNLKPTDDNFKVISEALNKTKSDYFELPELKHD